MELDNKSFYDNCKSQYKQKYDNVQISSLKCLFINIFFFLLKKVGKITLARFPTNMNFSTAVVSSWLIQESELVFEKQRPDTDF